MNTDIKIFVSNRIDINSESIDNPLFVPVRCGAVYDKNTESPLVGDDTGDNISERRMTFCEFTVQYWAWKNVKADYYGLCHYRRYLSFSDKRFVTDPVYTYNMVRELAITSKSKAKYMLEDAEKMTDIISQYDVVVSETAPVEKAMTPKGFQTTEWGLWEAQSGNMFEKKYMDILLQLIDRFAPEYNRAAKEFFSGNRHRGFNCYVMKKDLFNRLCNFQFPILFELEKMIDPTGYTDIMMRTPGYMGEILYGIFMYQISELENWKIKETQLVFFSTTEPVNGILDYWIRNLKVNGERVIRRCLDPLFPIGSKRRKFIRGIIRGKRGN